MDFKQMNNDVCYGCDFYDPEHGCVVHPKDKQYVCMIKKDKEAKSYYKGTII